MQGHFKHLRLNLYNGILGAHFGPFFAFPTKVLNIRNSHHYYKSGVQFTNLNHYQTFKMK
jgi:hypothetical protein